MDQVTVRADPEQPAVASTTPPQAPLGAIAAGGFAWNFSVAVLSKLLALVSQLVLARLLIPGDFGAYATASIIVAFASLLRDTGLPQVLVHRQKRLAEWENAAFWMSLALGTVAAIVMAGAGLAFYYRADGQTVAGLLFVAAVASPLIGVGIVPSVKLQTEFRFRLIAQISVGTAITTAALNIVLAGLGFGAYSLAIPQGVASAARALVLLHIARPTLQLRPEFRRWLLLLHDSGMMILSAVGFAIVGYCDYLVLLRHSDEETVGYYFFAFNLSVQAIMLLSPNLAGVLLPTLVRLNHDRERQVRAYLRACQALTALGAPVCILQAMLARPLVIVFLGTQWRESIPILQILSVGMIFAMSSFAPVLMQAQGRFLALAIWTAACSLVFLAMVQAGTIAAGAAGTAVAVSVFHLFSVSGGTRLAIARWGSGADVARMFAPVIGACAVATLPLFGMVPLWSEVYAGTASFWLTALICSFHAALFLLIYAMMLRLLARGLYEEISMRIKAPVLRALQFARDPRRRDQ